MANHPSTVTIKNFRGIDNRNPAERLEEGFLATANNIDIDASGAIRKRPGYALTSSGTNVHSLYADEDNRMLYVDDGSIKAYNKDTTTTVLGTGYPVNAKVDFLKILDTIYFSSLEYNGVIEGNIIRPWGIPRPPGMPILTIDSNPGNLTQGKYQIAITFVSSTGRESGIGLASVIEVTVDNSAILASLIPTTTTDSTVSKVRIYCTTPNGETLYLVKEVTLGTASHIITDASLATLPLKTQFISQAPEGELLALYNGRVYMAKGGTLWYSEPHSFEWFSIGSNFIQFPGNITNVMPVEDGIFVTADKLYFLEGNDPENFRQRVREIYKGIKRTAVEIIGSDILLENIPTGLKWLFSSNKGIIMVGQGGMVFNLTEKNVMIDTSDEGTAIFRSDRGINQYVSVLRNPDNNRLHVGDSATAEVIRNSITIT